jgi:hypothetical protein
MARNMHGSEENTYTFWAGKRKMPRMPTTKENFHGEITHKICCVEQQIFQTIFFQSREWEMRAEQDV